MWPCSNEIVGLSVPDYDMAYVFHVVTDVSGLIIPDIYMEKIELETESILTGCCKHDIQLAYMFSLVLWNL